MAREKMGLVLLTVLFSANVGCERPEEPSRPNSSGRASPATILLHETLSKPSAAANDVFGFGVAATGDFVIVGVPGDDTAAASAGAVYVFDASSGVPLQTIVNPSPGAADSFGFMLAASEGQVVVGDSFHDAGLTDVGAAYLFDVSSGALLKTFVNPDPDASDRFGQGVAIAEGRAVVGAFQDNSGANGSGSAYVFDTSTGALLLTIPNPVPAISDFFGWAVTANDSLVFVGAPPAGAMDSGVVYAFDASTGALQYTLTNPTPAANDNFGASLAASGGRVVVGAWSDDAGGTESGAAYVFEASTGALLLTLLNPTPAADDIFGYTVAAAAGRVAVGARHDSTLGTRTGAVYLFDLSTGSLIGTLLNPTPASDEEYAFALALAGDHVVVGAHADDGAGTNAGAAYVFGVTNSAPVALDDAVSAVEDSAATFALSTLLANDVDLDGDSLTMTDVTQGLSGSVMITGTSVVYTPETDFNGEDAFTYTIRDPSNAISTATVTVTVAAVEDSGPGKPSIAAPLDGSIVSTSVPSLTISNATDPDGDTVVYRFDLDTESSFATAAFQTSGVVVEGTAGSTSWVTAQLEEDTRYFWRVRATDGVLAGEWSVASFLVSEANDPPGIPLSIAPVDVVTWTETPTLTIENSGDPEGDTLTYEFEVREESETGEVVGAASDVVAGEERTSFLLTEPLKAGRVYVWRARAHDGGGGVSAWTSPASFEVNRDRVGGGGCGCALDSGRIGEARPSGWGLATAALIFIVRRRRERDAASRVGIEARPSLTDTRR